MRYDQLVVGDCISGMNELPIGSVDLLISDPPYGIGWSYDQYDDDTTYSEYLDFSRDWINAAMRVMSPTGTFWLIIGDSYAAELDVMCRREFGLTRRSWVVWHYSFGQNLKSKFTPSHTHCFHYVVDPKQFTFNGDAVKVPSARQVVYGDRRAAAGGRLPNDVWALRPQEHPNLFSATGDLWFIPRVCGTFKERVEHPCQAPLALLERMVLASSNPGDLVLDPFAGSGTTLVAAKKLGRRYYGFELSASYARIAGSRLESVAAEPSLPRSESSLV